MFRHCLTPPLAAGFPCYERVNTNPCLFPAAEEWIYPEFSSLKRSPGCERGWGAPGRVRCAPRIPPFAPSTATKSFILLTRRTSDTPKVAPGCGCDLRIRAVAGVLLCPLLPWHLLGVGMGAAGSHWVNYRGKLTFYFYKHCKEGRIKARGGMCFILNSVAERNLFIFWVSLFPECFVAGTCSRAVLSTFLQISFW